MSNSQGRHTDIAFIADRSLRREQLIAASSGILWEWRTDIRFGSTADGGPPLSGARIVLLVHGGDEVDFDWARARDAIANGCVVVAETSKGFAPLVPGMHFVMAPYENVVEQAVALAFDEPRRAAMAEAAATVTLPQPASPTPSAEPPGRHRRLRRRKSPSPGTQDYLLQQMVTELKVAILAQRELTRSIDATISTVEHGDADHADVIATSTWSSFDAEVSVVVPLVDEGHRLRETVESVIAASAEPGPRTELLIVDDHSTDASRDVAEKLLVEIDWFPATLLARAANGGPAVARNAGFNAARAAHVVALDAGGTLYPTSLRRLHDRLHSAPSEVIATYGLVERFDTTGSLGLAGHLPWDIDLLVQGEFAETLAMFRSEAWSQLGGFTTPTDGFTTPTEGVEDGWADYDLWLLAAERGLRAEPVGSVVGRHREPLASMLNVGEIDVASTFITLRERHPRLPWPS